MTKSTDKESPVEETKVASTGPTAAEIYHKLVHTPITGWPEKKIVEHRKKCADALAAKQKK